jgi:PKHD-type hydroxylase
MMLHIPAVLTADELRSIGQAVANAPFVDGRLTAGAVADAVKANQELDRTAPVRDVLARALIGSLYRQPAFRDGVLPHRVATPIIARYTPSMRYGDHVDDPIMGAEGARYRSDVSITLVLSPPAAYAGGELVIRTPFGEQRVKGEAGDAVAYPSGSLHRVEEVTGGERLVAVLWVQSLVRDPARREVLYDLARARDLLLAQAGGEAHAAVDRSYVNLVRMWSDL